MILISTLLVLYLIVLFMMANIEESLTGLFSRFAKYGINVKCCFDKDCKPPEGYKVILTKSLVTGPKYAEFTGDNIFTILKDAWLYVEENLTEWEDHTYG